MILYLDTSALVKKYFMEPGTDDVISLWRSASAIIVSSVAYAESMAAFHRKERESSMQTAAFRSIVAHFDRDYASLIRVHVNDELNGWIPDILSKHPLRGFDAVHLASALMIQHQLTTPLLFVCYDQKLIQAAAAEMLRVFPEPTTFPQPPAFD